MSLIKYQDFEKKFDGSLVIGRDIDVLDLSKLVDKNVSKVHAIISRDMKGLFIENVTPTNTTILNSRISLEKGQRYYISEGDSLLIAGIQLTLQNDSPQKKIASTEIPQIDIHSVLKILDKHNSQDLLFWPQIESKDEIKKYIQKNLKLILSCEEVLFSSLHEVSHEIRDKIINGDIHLVEREFAGIICSQEEEWDEPIVIARKNTKVFTAQDCHCFEYFVSFWKKQIDYQIRQYTEEKKITAIIEKYLIGTSKKIQEIKSLLKKILPTRCNVLLLGETGTGKGQIALIFKEYTEYKGLKYNKHNCNASNPNLIESDLFGHVKGSFTNAVCNKDGILHITKNGCLFFDEIATYSDHIQRKILSFLEEKEFKKIGSNETIALGNIRFIFASNEDIGELVRQGKFMKDLYARINSISIRLPALRERKEDIPILAKHLLAEKYSNRYFDEEALKELQRFDWTHNVRQLGNVIERICTFETGQSITAQMVKKCYEEISPQFNAQDEENSNKQNKKINYLELCKSLSSYHISKHAFSQKELFTKANITRSDDLVRRLLYWGWLKKVSGEFTTGEHFEFTTGEHFGEYYEFECFACRECGKHCLQKKDNLYNISILEISNNPFPKTDSLTKDYWEKFTIQCPHCRGKYLKIDFESITKRFPGL